MPSKLGVGAAQLSDEDLERELLQLYRTREETFMSGSADALRTHTDRMLELEHEYATRFPDRVRPDDRRTRRGARGEDGPRTSERDVPRMRPPTDS
jgi:Family of unknown function (DUF6158)